MESLCQQMDKTTIKEPSRFNEDLDIDDLCKQFTIKLKDLDPEEEWENLLVAENRLRYIDNPKDLRCYMTEVSNTISRYNLSFVTDLHIHSPDHKFIKEIQETTNKFLDMWSYFVKYEHSATQEDLICLRDIALSVFRWIIKSINDYYDDLGNDLNYLAETNFNTKGTEGFYCDETGGIYDEYHEEYDDISRDYEDQNK